MRKDGTLRILSSIAKIKENLLIYLLAHFTWTSGQMIVLGTSLITCTDFFSDFILF